MTSAYLGIDTSNYTTSVAAISSDGRLLADARALLPVSAGERGLRQSEALYHHVQRIPGLTDQLLTQLGGTNAVQWLGIGVSVRPRPFQSSYMPVFTAGQRFAEFYARLNTLPLVHTSHQEGHLEAALLSLNTSPAGPFLAVHLSGGTSDVMVAESTRFGFRIDMVGEGADLHAGQFVDRVGVMLGLPFPAGPSLERLAASGSGDSTFRIPSRTLGSSLSFSGPCAAAERAIQNGVPASDIALAVQACIASSVAKAVHHATQVHTGLSTAVIAGGVASNQWIRSRVIHRLRILSPTLHVLFAEARYASDNAYGVAGIARRYLYR